MFKIERIRKIKELVYSRKQIDVATLSSLLNVSGVTIRSDLEQLEDAGFLIRTHGGAILNETSTSQEDTNDILLGKTLQYDKNKESIGKLAASLIADQEWVFLGPHETCYYIARELRGRQNLNILTNNVYVINALLGSQNIHVIAAGGNLNHKHSCFMGDPFTKSVEDFYLRKAFFSIDGADFSAGYTVADSGEMNLIKAIAKRTSEMIYLVGSKKFDSISFTSVGDLVSVSTVISNSDMPNQYKKFYFENNIRVLTAYDLNPAI
ncbi:DeoR family transcriptional regulator [Spirochaetia bacterium]|nr:DeoR family transcriptional regulator [Spirochaetia bacterium]